MKKILRLVDHFEEYLAGGMLLLMAILYFLEVVFRYAFSHSNAWVEELLRYMMVFITFFGASVAVKYGSHMSVNVIEYIPSKTVKRVFELFVALMGIVFSGLILYLSWLLVLRIKGFGQRSPAMQIPMYVPYAILPLGFVSMLVRFSHKFLTSFKILFTRGN